MVDKISIVIPNYNNAKYLDDCLKSVLEQTYKNVEVIVADDDSTDDSRRIISAYKKKYPAIFMPVFASRNRGVAYNRDRGIRAASGEYITTLDSDDVYYSPEKLKREMEIISWHRSRRNSDVCAFSNAVILSEDLDFIRERGAKNDIKEGWILKDILARSCEIPLDFLMKKESYFKIGGYDYGLDVYEDWDLKIRLAEKHEFYFSGVNGTGYRQHDKGLSTMDLDKNIKSLEKVFEKNVGRLKEKEKKETIAEFHFFLNKARIATRIREKEFKLFNSQKRRQSDINSLLVIFILKFIRKTYIKFHAIFK